LAGRLISEKLLPFLCDSSLLSDISEQKTRSTAGKQRDGVHCVQRRDNNTGAELLLVVFCFGGVGREGGTNWNFLEESREVLERGMN